ncbi:MAG: 5-formyltetrahydrofolate cyclo-ligase [Paracoccus sp. (in: a-proteobacteria)]|nr:5-formyltetrahydrofolate cyclo-ligase [Paracoccus sp. (in: a-proteobacteria)]
MDIAVEKAALRARLAQRRAKAASPDAQAALAVVLAGLLRDHAGQGRTLSFYWPMGSEADPRPALAAWDGPLCLPVTTRKGSALIFRRFSPADTLEPGPFGTSHPAPSAPALTPDLLIVPLLGFDSAGNRLGYGGGFYDRTLAELRASGPRLAIGLGFDAQREAHIPAEPTDQRLDLIVTQSGVFAPGEADDRPFVGG